MYNKILVPTDASAVSQQALPYAELLAENFGSSIEFLYCLETEEISEDVAEKVEQEVLEELNRVADGLPKGIRGECVVAPGRPAEVIVDRAATDPGNLVAMCTHGYHGLNRWILGSVTTKVVQASRNPVLAVRAETDGKGPVTPAIEKILVPLDGSELAEKSLEHVTAISKKLGAEVILLRTYHTRLPGSSVRMYQVDEIVHEAAEAYLGRIAGELRQQGISNVSCKTLHGWPAGEIIDYASSTPNSLIAMTSHGHSGVGRWLLGSVTTAVVRHADRPVLVTRAD